MEYVSGSTAEHDSEVDNAEWLPLETAMKKISFKGDRSILEKAKAKLEDLYSVE
jgi:predicted NUDIX family NTP pyrophosphohydrolase